MIIMAANAGGIAGSQVFRTADAPGYITAFTACLALAAVCVLEIIAQTAWYLFSNRRLAKKGGEMPVVTGTTDATTDGHTEALVKKWWWTW